MKNLHKKIGVVILSGMLLAGGSLAANISVVHASASKSASESIINDIGKNGGFYVVSRDFDEEDRSRIESKYPDYGDIKYPDDKQVFNSIWDLIQYLIQNGYKLNKGLYKVEICGDYMVIKKD